MLAASLMGSQALWIICICVAVLVGFFALIGTVFSFDEEDLIMGLVAGSILFVSVALLIIGVVRLVAISDQKASAQQQEQMTKITNALQLAADGQQTAYQRRGEYVDDARLRFYNPALNGNKLADDLQVEVVAGGSKYFISYEDDQHLFSISGSNGLTVDRSCDSYYSICQDGQWANPGQEQR